MLAVYGPFKVQHLQTVKNKIINASYVARSYLASRVFGDRSYDSDPFFFVHIPKTAGTTFLRVLYQSEPHALIYPNAYEHFIDNQGKYLGHQELMKDPNFLASVKQRKWIVGHFNYHIIHRWSDHPRMLTFLRKPFERTVSEIVHLKTKHPLFKSLSLEQVILRLKAVLGMRSAAVFGYHPRKENLQEAIMHLRECCFVGLTEHFKTSINLCNALLHTRLYSKGAHNVGPPALIREVSEQYGDMLREMIQIDQQFYTAGLVYFQELASEAGLSIAHDKKV